MRLQLPRQFDEEKFLKSLNGQPKAKVQIVFDRDTMDGSILGAQLFNLLQNAGWIDVVLSILPRQRTGIGWMLPETAALGAASFGISVVAQLFDSPAPPPGTAFLALWRAIATASDALIAPTAGADPKLPADTLRVVIARRS